MISNHSQFTAALHDRKKVCVRFYSKPDSGVLDRVCAPMDYGPGADSKDGLNRYWLWDYANETGTNMIGLLPQQIMDLQVLGELFNPSEFVIGPTTPPTPPAAVGPIPTPTVPVSTAKTPIL